MFCFGDLTPGISQGMPGDTIIWSKDRLKWSDFQQDHSTDKPVSFAAKSKWQMLVRYLPSDEHPEVKIPVVTAIFFRKLSWVKPSVRENEDVLRHEQLHFDIVELYARKLRVALGEMVISSDSLLKAARKIVRKIHDELLETQEKYDWETSHGTDKKKQVWWTTWVFVQLEKTQAQLLNGSAPSKTSLYSYFPTWAKMITKMPVPRPAL